MKTLELNARELALLRFGLETIQHLAKVGMLGINVPTIDAIRWAMDHATARDLLARFDAIPDGATLELPPVAPCVWAPLEPTPRMLDKAEHVLSEWLNDNAPIGQSRYREPGLAAYRAMLATLAGDT